MTTYFADLPAELAREIAYYLLARDARMFSTITDVAQYGIIHDNTYAQQMYHYSYSSNREWLMSNYLIDAHYCDHDPLTIPANAFDYINALRDAQFICDPRNVEQRPELRVLDSGLKTFFNHENISDAVRCNFDIFVRKVIHENFDIKTAQTLVAATMIYNRFSVFEELITQLLNGQFQPGTLTSVRIEARLENTPDDRVLRILHSIVMFIEEVFTDNDNSMVAEGSPIINRAFYNYLTSPLFKTWSDRDKNYLRILLAAQEDDIEEFTRVAEEFPYDNKRELIIRADALKLFQQLVSKYPELKRYPLYELLHFSPKIVQWLKDTYGTDYIPVEAAFENSGYMLTSKQMSYFFSVETVITWTRENWVRNTQTVSIRQVINYRTLLRMFLTQLSTADVITLIRNIANPFYSQPIDTLKLFTLQELLRSDLVTVPSYHAYLTAIFDNLPLVAKDYCPYCYCYLLYIKYYFLANTLPKENFELVELYNVSAGTLWQRYRAPLLTIVPRGHYIPLYPPVDFDESKILPELQLTHIVFDDYEEKYEYDPYILEVEKSLAVLTGITNEKWLQEYI